MKHTLKTKDYPSERQPDRPVLAGNFIRADRLSTTRGFTRTPQRGLVAQKAQRLRARPRLVSGFTLVELIIVVAIFAVFSTVILVRHSQFGGSLLLGNLTYDIALSIREAQSFGLQAREFEGSFIGKFGVHFASGETSYVLFADIDGNGVRNLNDPWPEDVETFTLRGGHSISEVCITVGSDPEDCSLTTLDIVFNRPNPDALINEFNNADARIVVTSTTGSIREVTITSTGQISVEQNN